jgi:serine/threonine protein phosphatase 1
MNWVIGDVHGMYGPLRRLLDAVHAADANAQLVFAGDYVNRGPDSHKAIDLLLSLTNARFCRGNHDDIFDLVLHGACVAPKAAGGQPGAAYQWFMDYGLDHTLHSYGLSWDWLKATAADPTVARLAHLHHAVPPAHRAFIHGLPIVIEGDGFFVTHGYWSPTSPCYPPTLVDAADDGSDDLRQSMLWGRYTPDEIEADKRQWNRRGFVGHTPVHSYFPDPANAPLVPIVGPKLTLLDTACALLPWGRLTAYCVEEDRIIQFTHAGEPVDTEWSPIV